jgi:hypothetical protein
LGAIDSDDSGNAYGIAPESRRAPAEFRAALDDLGLGDIYLVEMSPGQTIRWEGVR